MLVRQLQLQIPEQLKIHLQQVALEAMAFSIDWVTIKTASKLWLTPHFQAELRLGAEEISHMEAAILLLSHRLASEGVQTSNKAGVTCLHTPIAGTS